MTQGLSSSLWLTAQYPQLHLHPCRNSSLISALLLHQLTSPVIFRKTHHHPIGHSSRSSNKKILAWLDTRVGRITASLAEDVMSLRGTSEGKSLISRIFGTAKSFSSPAVEYGRKMEGVARHLYEDKMTTEHKSFSSQTKGLHVMKDRPYLRASPDAIASCNCHGVRLVEIKCRWNKAKAFQLNETVGQRLTNRGSSKFTSRQN